MILPSSRVFPSAAMFHTVLLLETWQLFFLVMLCQGPESDSGLLKSSPYSLFAFVHFPTIKPQGSNRTMEPIKSAQNAKRVFVMRKKKKKIVQIGLNPAMNLVSSAPNPRGDISARPFFLFSHLSALSCLYVWRKYFTDTTNVRMQTFHLDLEIRTLGRSLDMAACHNMPTCHMVNKLSLPACRHACSQSYQLFHTNLITWANTAQRYEAFLFFFCTFS